MRTIFRLAMLLTLPVIYSGCYTQFAATSRKSAEPPPFACPDTLSDSACAQLQSQRARDTVVIRDTDRQICHWTRNWWGEPVLSCYKTWYSDSWVSYYSSPWWYNNYDNYGYGYNRCPSNYYYDSYTGYCRYYRDYNTYWYPSGGSSQNPPGGSRSAPPRRTSQPRPSTASEGQSLPKTTDGRELQPYIPGGSGYSGSSAPAAGPSTPPRRTVSPAPGERTQAVTPSAPKAPAPQPSVPGTEGRAAPREVAPRVKETQQPPAPAAEGTVTEYPSNSDKKKDR